MDCSPVSMPSFKRFKSRIFVLLQYFIFDSAASIFFSMPVINTSVLFLLSKGRVILHPFASFKFGHRSEICGDGLIVIGACSRINLSKYSVMKLNGVTRVGPHCYFHSEAFGEFSFSSNSIAEFVSLHAGKQMSIDIGFYTSVNRYSMLIGDITIYARTIVDPFVFIGSTSHQFKLSNKLSIEEQDKAYRVLSGGKEWSSPISVGSDCWIRVNSVVLPGSRIPDKTILPAGCLIQKNTKFNTTAKDVYCVHSDENKC